MVESAKANGINDKPAFICWVTYTPCKQDTIIVLVKSQVYKTTHKCSIEVPRDMKDTKHIDLENGYTFWQDLIGLEMNTLLPDFNFCRERDRHHVGYSKSS